jgi:hypothetical protein
MNARISSMTRSLHPFLFLLHSPSRSAGITKLTNDVEVIDSHSYNITEYLNRILKLFEQRKGKHKGTIRMA